MFFRSREWKYLRYDIMQRWERLLIRQWINQNPKIVTGITAVLLLLFLVIVVCQFLPGKPVQYEGPKKAWFYDLNTGELFTAKSKLLPPTKAPSGPLPDGTPAGVRAYVFYSNAPNDTDTEPFVGFLETLSPQAKQSKASLNSKTHSAKQWAKGRSFRRPDEDKWFPADSDQGRSIFNEFFVPGNNREPPLRCYPPQ